MAITGNASFGPTTQEFSVNWAAANVELAPGSIVLAGQYAQTQFATDRTALLALMDETSERAQDARNAATTRDNLKSEVSVRVKQLRGVILGKITDKDVLKDLLPVPPFKDNPALFVEPIKAMNRLWIRINANATQLELGGPLILQGGYTQTMFEAAIAQMAASFDTAIAADENLGTARGKRDNAMAAIYERMKQYRASAPAELPENSPALANLPRLTPAAGTTPAALVVEGVWDNALGKAVFTWPVSTVKNLAKLQARGCTGTTYKADDEEIIADLAPDAVRFETEWGLGAPGAKICVKIYVMTSAGNENGGKAVKIVRPDV